MEYLDINNALHLNFGKPIWTHEIKKALGTFYVDVAQIYDLSLEIDKNKDKYPVLVNLIEKWMKTYKRSKAKKS